MKIIQYLWMKRLTLGMAVIAVPLAAIAHGLAGDELEICPPMPHSASLTAPPPGFFPAAPPPGAMPMPPYLRGIELTEAQQDKLFELLHAEAPNERKELKEAFKAMEKLRRLAASDNFEVDKARVLADVHAQALSRVVLMHAVLDAKVRAFLTPEQRKQIDAERVNAEKRRNLNRS